MLVEQGIPDTSPSSAYQTYEGDNLVTKYKNYIVEPGKVNIGASVLFDTVSTGVGGLYNLSIPAANVSNTLHLTARDEDRTFFPLVSAVDRDNPNDPRVLELRLPGAHSDLGGSYDVGGLGHMNLKLAYTYLDRLGVPMAPFPKACEPNPDSFVIHDSRWIRNEPFTNLLNRGVQREVDYVRRR